MKRHMNDAKVMDCTKRVLRMTMKQHMTVGECSAVHINCLVSLALEHTGLDIDRAEALLRATWIDVLLALHTPGLTAEKIK